MRSAKRQTGFTMIELLIAIIVIGILSSIATINFLQTQKSSRDEQRSSRSHIISEALEQYYKTNGEYPSVPAVTDTNGQSVVQLLTLDDAKFITMPGVESSTTNSITTADPTSMNWRYTASSVNATENTACQSSVSGGCDQYTLSWKTESHEDKSVTSRQSGR